MSTHFILPGLAGNSFSTEDKNLLDADTAHLVQGTGGWYAWGTVSNIALEASADADFGPNVLAFDGDSANNVISTGDGATKYVEVSAATEYSFAVDLLSSFTLDFRLQLVWFDSGGGFLSASLGDFATLTADTWTRRSWTATSPASAARCVALLDYGNSTAADTYRVKNACLALGADATFVPSLRIVGDLDIEAKVACDFTPATEMSVLSFGFINYAPRMDVRINGDLGFTIGAVAAYDSTDAISASDNTPTVFRITTSGTSANFYEDGVAMGAAVTILDHAAIRTTEGYSVGNAGLSGTSTNLFTGDVYYVEVRDGIGGPIVGRLNPSDIPLTTQALADGFEWTDSVTGRTWKVNGTGVSIVQNVRGNPSFVTTDGLAGTYIDTPNVNLAGADEGNMQQSIGTWRSNQYAVPIHGTPPVAPPAAALGFTKGAYFDAQTVIGAAYSILSASPGAGAGIPVSPSTEYTYSVDVMTEDVGSVGRRARIRMLTYDASGTNLQSFYSGYTSLAVDTFTRLSVTNTVAGTAVAVLLAVYVESEDGVEVPATGERAWACAVCVREGSNPAFLPSFNIDGDLAHAAEISTPVFPPAAGEQIMGAYNSSTNMRMRMLSLADTTLRLQYADAGGTLVSATSGVTSPPTDRPFTYAQQRIAASGDVTHFLDGVQQGAVGSTPAGAIGQVGNQTPFTVCGRGGGTSEGFAGSMYEAKMFDGVGGPAVIDFDPSQFPLTNGAIPDGTEVTDKMGRVWTFHGGIIFTEATSAPADLKIKRYAEGVGSGRDIRVMDGSMAIKRYESV